MSKKIYCKGSVVVLLCFCCDTVLTRAIYVSLVQEYVEPQTIEYWMLKMAKYELFDAWVSITTVLNFAKILTFWVLVSIAVGWNPASMWLVCNFSEGDGSGGNVWKFTQWRGFKKVIEEDLGVRWLGDLKRPVLTAKSTFWNDASALRNCCPGHILWLHNRQDKSEAARAIQRIWNKNSLGPSDSVLASL